MKIEIDGVSGEKKFLVDEKPMQIFDVEQFLSAVAGYGQKEEGRDLNTFDRYHYYSTEWSDMGQRVQFLDDEQMALPGHLSDTRPVLGGRGRRPLSGRRPLPRV